MTLKIPQALHSLLAEADASTEPIDDMELAGKLAAALGTNPSLSAEERKGAFSEIEALRFQRPHGIERGTWGTYWSELSSGTTSAGKPFYSPDIAYIDEDVLNHWLTRSAGARHPSLRARFSDLAWEFGRLLTKPSKPGEMPTRQPLSVRISHDLAQRAIDAYLEAMDRKLYEDDYQAWQFLDRAVELSASLKDQPRLAKCKSVLFAYQRDVEAAHPDFMLWRFDEIAWNRAGPLALSDDEKQSIIAVLERALARRADSSDKMMFDPHAAMDIADRLARRRMQRNERDDARRALKLAGAAFEEAAKGAQALVASAWLEDLIPRYRNEGLSADVARIEAAIRTRAAEAQGELKHVEVPYSIPKAEIESWADNVSGASGQEAFRRIATACLIREGSTQQSIQNMVKNSPLLALMPSAILGDDGFTTATVGSINDDLDGRTIQHAADLFSWNAVWLHAAFARITEKHEIDLDILMAWLMECPFFAESRAPLLRSGLAAWKDQDAIKTIHVLVPQVEAALRDVLASLGAAIHTPEPKIGGFRVIGMGEILSHDQFKTKVPGDMRFHLRALYSDPRGINLRNHVAHGLAHPSLFNLNVANWVVHSLLLVALLRPPQSSRAE